MNKIDSGSNKKWIKQFLKNEFFWVGSVCFVLYFVLSGIAPIKNVSYSIVYTYNHFQIIEILALIILSYAYSIKGNNEINLKKNLILSVSYLSGSVLIYCCVCIVLLAFAMLLLPIIIFGTALGIGIIGDVTASVGWFINILILRFIYTFGTIFIVTTFIKIIKKLIQSKNINLNK